MKEVQKQFERFITDEKTPNEDRLIMLCDGVFAIALTLLVLDISIHPGDPSAPTVDNALWGMLRPSISYLVTFFIIAMYWRFHRSLMQVVERLDSGFITLTFLFLAFIAFFPVISRLVGDHGNVGSVIILYTLVLSGCGFCAFGLWFYATWKHRLVSPDLPQEAINTRTIALLLNPLIYCASLLLLRVVPPNSPYLICFSWALIGYTQRGVRQVFQFIYKRWLQKPMQEFIHHEHNTTPASVHEQAIEKLPDTPVGPTEEELVPEEAEQQ